MSPQRGDLDFVFWEGRKNYTLDGNGKRTKDAYAEFSVRQFVAFRRCSMRIRRAILGR